MRSAIFVWRRYPPPFLIGGAEVSQRLLAEELVGLGWRVLYLGSHEPPWSRASELEHFKHALDGWGIRYRIHRGGQLQYRWNGIDCYSIPQHMVSPMLADFLRIGEFDLVITAQEGSAQLARQASGAAPVTGWLHSVSNTGLEVLEGGPYHALATSKFVLRRMRQCSKTKFVLFYPPFTDAGSQATGHDHRDGLLMINPVPPKGGEFIKRLAKSFPERKFTVVEGWWDTRTAFIDLANVRYVPRTYDMNKIYSAHQVLLVPSVVEDAFPRVIIEAGLTGLPSVGSDRGGIPEAIADGGVVLPPDDLHAWSEAIDMLDDTTVTDYSARARRNALRFVRSCVEELFKWGVIAT